MTHHNPKALLNDITVPDTFSIPKEVEFVCDSVAPLLAGISTYCKTLEDSEEKLQFLRTELTPYAKAFLKLVNSKRNSQEPIPLETAIRLFGIEPTFDLLFATAFVKELPDSEVKWDESTGQTNVSPDKLIPYAIAARERFGFGSRHASIAFQSGFIFDILRELNERLGQNKKNTATLIQEQFNAGLKLSVLGLKEGRSFSRLRLEAMVIPTIMLKRAGRVIFAIMNPNYEKFAHAIEKIDFRSPFAHLAERKMYGISNNIVSAILAKFIPNMQDSSAALLFYDYPHLLDDTTRLDVHDLVTLCTRLAVQQREKDKG